jgi:hypothetical protein
MIGSQRRETGRFSAMEHNQPQISSTPNSINRLMHQLKAPHLEPKGIDEQFHANIIALNCKKVKYQFANFLGK